MKLLEAIWLNRTVRCWVGLPGPAAKHQYPDKPISLSLSLSFFLR